MSRQLEREQETLMDIFHRHRQNDEHGLAAIALERASQTPEYYPEASIWKGIAALPVDPKLAFISLSTAAHALPKRADVQALVGRSILAQSQPALATRYLKAAWQKLPDEPALRMMLWQARSQCETPENLRKLIVAQLPDITSPTELALVLKLLSVQKLLPGHVGVVRYLPDMQEIHGWAINLRDLQNPVSLKLEASGHVISMVANIPNPLLTAAGLPATHGGIRIKVPNPTAAVHICFETGETLQGSPVFAMPAFAPPPAATDVGNKQPVDVLIPVYDGLEETLECINSAIGARKLNRTPHRLVVIEDITPIPGLRKALKVLAAKGKITLIQNPVNLGFIRSMNRAMALSPKQDVVWLNADTRVHGNWLDRLRTVAYSDKQIASVTPFTNNGELMSFPESRFSHPMPSADEQAQLDDLARLTDSLAVEIETGCGFCLYIKRNAIDEVGYLDEVGLSRGYGEETDWCLRARALGWHHMGAPNVFVAHQGGISFGDEKDLRVAQNNAILKRRYPDASTRYQDFCLRDPIKPARQALQRARLAQLPAQIAQRPAAIWPTKDMKQLHVENGDASKAPLCLRWRYEGSRVLATLHAQLKPLDLTLDYELPADSERLLEDLRNLPFESLTYLHLAGCPKPLFDLPAQLDKPYRIICRDDELLRNATPNDWSTFAGQATQIDLPWEALQERYEQAIPQACFLAHTGQPTLLAPKCTPDVLLIADTLDSADIGIDWVSLARRITREKLAVLLLIHGESPWHQSLLATGAVRAVHTPDGLTLAECLNLTGCHAALSLEPNPGAGWRAPVLAQSMSLSLYAMPSLAAKQAGALPITHLPLHRAKPDVR